MERAAARTEITIETVTKMLPADRAAAYERGQIGVAKGAADSLAKLQGQWVDRHDVRNKYEHMIDEGLGAALAKFFDDAELMAGSIGQGQSLHGALTERTPYRELCGRWGAFTRHQF